MISVVDLKINLVCRSCLAIISLLTFFSISYNFQDNSYKKWTLRNMLRMKNVKGNNNQMVFSNLSGTFKVAGAGLTVSVFEIYFIKAKPAVCAWFSMAKFCVRKLMKEIWEVNVKHRDWKKIRNVRNNYVHFHFTAIVLVSVYIWNLTIPGIYQFLKQSHAKNASNG